MKASVFPLPVGAVTITFLFSNRAGITCICTGVGRWMPILPKDCTSGGLTLYFLHTSLELPNDLSEVIE